MKTVKFYFLLVTSLLFLISISFAQVKVGDQKGRATMVSTGQLVRSAGEAIAFAGRPVDIALSPDGTTAYIKTHVSMITADTKDWKVLQELPYGKNRFASMHGIAVSPDGRYIYLTVSASTMLEAGKDQEGKWEWKRSILLKSRDTEDSNPCGIALSRDGKTAYTALSRNNTLAYVDLVTGTMTQETETGVAPYGVILSPDGKTAYVSNWGGRHPAAGERKMESSGTQVPVNERDQPISGTVSRIDLVSGRVTGEAATGLHPSDMVMQKDGSLLYTANVNSDNISVIDLSTFKVKENISVRPGSSLPFGSLPDALSLSSDGSRLFAANAGNNAIAVIDLKSSEGSRVKGFIPAGWFPAAIVNNGDYLYCVNTKGDGGRSRNDGNDKYFVKWHRGTANKIKLPSDEKLKEYTSQVKQDALIPQVLKSYEKDLVWGTQAEIQGKPAKGKAPAGGNKKVPVPVKKGESSVFEHVIYVIKENRTYDQMLGDIGKGNSDPKLCIYGKDVTPNHHALADEFILLDNYYCNGVVSAEGHQWATQGIITDYNEKAFGAWSRSYGFGSDPLTFAPTDMIWDNVLLHGLSFRNYGEFLASAPESDSILWSDIYKDYREKTNRIKLNHINPMESLKPYTCSEYPGWELRIPDQLRLDVFLKEFREFEANGNLPDFMVVYLPQDHTSGKRAGTPTPRAHVADNDLAIGRLVEAVSNSRYWKNSVIFINEDDPQDGFDHVDGHRSLCLVVSPYTKRGAVVSKFYNQSSVLHTIENIFGLPPMNQMDAMAPLMNDCFTARPDYTPFKSKANIIPLDEMNKATSMLNGEDLLNEQLSRKMDLSVPDRIDDDIMNRILWSDAKGIKAPYPKKFAGAHGRGLRKLGLKLSGTVQDDD